MNLFLNTEEKRPRSGWRILLQFVIFFLLSSVFFGAAFSLFGPAMPDILQYLFSAVAAGLSVWVAARYIDQRSLNQFGLGGYSSWKRDFIAGFAIGAVAMSLIFISEWLAGALVITGFGWERLSGNPYIFWLAGYFLSMAMVGFYEELIFRGYQIQNFTEGFQTPSCTLRQATAGAVALSSVIFGLLHAGNPNATWISTLNIMGAGIVLAIPYLVTGNLSASIGMHISWNFFQGGIYGFAVSGQPFRGSLLQIRQGGSVWFTGGAFGPEAGLTGLMGFLVMLIIFYIFCLKYDYTWSIHPSFNKRHSVSVNSDEQSS